jgi:hypothetical protein
MSFHSPVRRLGVPFSCRDLDLSVVARVLVKHRANVHAAARELNVPSGDLRKLTWSHPRLVELALEEAERLVDRAEARVREALDGDHAERSLRAAMFILSHSAPARERGWGPHGGGRYDAPPTAGAVIVQWAGGMPSGYRPASPNVPEARRQSLVDQASDPSRAADLHPGGVGVDALERCGRR